MSDLVKIVVEKHEKLVKQNEQQQITINLLTQSLNILMSNHKSLMEKTNELNKNLEMQMEQFRTSYDMHQRIFNSKIIKLKKEITQLKNTSKYVTNQELFDYVQNEVKLIKQQITNDQKLHDDEVNKKLKKYATKKDIEELDIIEMLEGVDYVCGATFRKDATKYEDFVFNTNNKTFVQTQIEELIDEKLKKVNKEVNKEFDEKFEENVLDIVMEKVYDYEETKEINDGIWQHVHMLENLEHNHYPFSVIKYMLQYKFCEDIVVNFSNLSIIMTFKWSYHIDDIKRIEAYFNIDKDKTNTIKYAEPEFSNTNISGKIQLSLTFKTFEKIYVSMIDKQEKMMILSKLTGNKSSRNEETDMLEQMCKRIKYSM